MNKLLFVAMCTILLTSCKKTETSNSSESEETNNFAVDSTNTIRFASETDTTEPIKVIELK